MFAGKFFKKMISKPWKRRLVNTSLMVNTPKLLKITLVPSAYLDENQLTYASRSHEAFKMWLKANNAVKALELARTVFHVLDDTG